MLHSLRRQTSAALSMSIAIVAVSPTLAHAASTASRPKLTSKLVGTPLIPLTANPPAPPTPHLTGTFVPSGTDNGTQLSGTLTVAGSMSLSGSNTIDLTDLNTILNNVGTISPINTNLGTISPINTNLGTISPINTNPGTIVLAGGNSFGSVELAGGSGILITDPTSSPIDTTPILNGGVLTITSGAGTLNAGTLNISSPPAIPTPPETVSIADLNTFLSQLHLTSSGNLSTTDLTDLNEILNELGTTSSDPAAQSSTPSFQVVSAATLLPPPNPLPSPSSRLPRSLLLKRRRV